MKDAVQLAAVVATDGGTAGQDAVTAKQVKPKRWYNFGLGIHFLQPSIHISIDTRLHHVDSHIMWWVTLAWSFYDFITNS